MDTINLYHVTKWPDSALLGHKWSWETMNICKSFEQKIIAEEKTRSSSCEKGHLVLLVKKG